MATDSVPLCLTGATAIGRALGASGRSVRRWIKEGKLRAYRLAGNTSPWKVDRAELARFRQAMKSEAEGA